MTIRTSASGRQDPVTTGSYLASGLSGSNSAASLQKSTRARCPYLPLAEIESGHSQVTRIFGSGRWLCSMDMFN